MEEKGVLGKRSGKTAWHFLRPTSIDLARVLNASVSTCLRVCVCIHMRVCASMCVYLEAGVQGGWKNKGKTGKAGKAATLSG